MEELYREQILEHYKRPHNFGVLEHPALAFQDNTPFCGDEQHVSIRLADEGKLALAGPFDGVDGWRGLFVFAVKDIEEARRLTATDPVIAKGEMVAEFHRYYGSAALMLVRETHDKVAKKRF